ncbi:MAG: DedA family protein [Phycisphaerae bacterium]
MLNNVTLAFSLSETIKNVADEAIRQGGLWGAAGMMALESMIAPVPSEVVMPPLGFAVARGEFTWTGAIIATSIGSLIGSLISYYLGYFGGKPLVMKVGKYLLLNEEHLDLTTRWFNRHGSLTVFICRFIPVVRHFISIPAGMAKMSLPKFCAYTLIGATIWNTFLMWVGFKLQEHWSKIEQYRKPVDAVIVVLGVMAIVAWIALHVRAKPAAATKEKNKTGVGV